jgi:phosphoserine aminotransferase
MPQCVQLRTTVAEHGSMCNTPPTYRYLYGGLDLPMAQTPEEGALQGVAAMEHRNIAKAQLLYDFLDSSSF